ncbi:MAG: hypothetical protein HY279_00740 [Nitrospinae bacterium]|nr:hypothetical protein [Nitrospinota bacterium]
MKIVNEAVKTFSFTSVIFSFVLFLKLLHCGSKEKIKSRSRKSFYSLLIFLGFIYFVLVAGQSAFAEERTDRYRLVNFDLLGAVFGMARVEYQQNIDEKSAWAVRGIFWHSTTESWKWDSYGGGFSYRKYITHNAPEGGWIGGGIDVLYTNAKYMGKEDNGYFVFPHAEAGYTFSLTPHSPPYQPPLSPPSKGGDKGEVKGGDTKGGWLITPSVSLGNYIGNIEISNSNIPISGAGMRLSVLVSYLF